MNRWLLASAESTLANKGSALVSKTTMDSGKIAR